MRLFNIPPDVDFLPALARAVLGGGFPDPDASPPDLLELPRWTILLPTRRAARSLQQAFLDAGPTRARLLPRIKPIGDIDDETIEPTAEDISLPPPLDPLARQFLLIRLIDEWARANPDQVLAQELAQSPAQALSLAIGLGELVDSFESEEISFDGLAQLFAGDFAVHRSAILDFLKIIRLRLPEEIEKLGAMGAVRRQSLSIIREAERLEAHPPQFPVIVAGATGTVPASARLLKVIAGLPNGAVVLPGLDTGIDDASWAALEPQHGQYGLKMLLVSLGLERKHVPLLPSIEESPHDRAWLAGEIMRPTPTTAQWRDVIVTNKARIASGLAGVELIEAASRHEEAATIAMIMRHCLTEPGRTAALVTPDRDLARRVKAELGRWSVEIDDSAGEPLVRTQPGALLSVLVDLAMTQFSATALAALLHHPLARLGPIARLFEAAVLRQQRLKPGLANLAGAAAAAREAAKTGEHVHGHVRRISPPQWNEIIALAQTLEQKLTPLAQAMQASEPLQLADVVAALYAAADVLAGETLRQNDDGDALCSLLATLCRQSRHLPTMSFEGAIRIILYHLRTTPVRQIAPAHPRLRIYGLLEARLVRSDITILGGLNEGIWPGRPETGPWLNRPMREGLSLQPVERRIGQWAHDFTQGFGAERVVLTWSRRLGDEPAVPSRWVLRLRMLMQGAGLAAAEHSWRSWCKGLDAPETIAPARKPAPRPPLAARPQQLSITRIEQLIRDPYAIFARSVLRLEPLPDIAAKPDYAARGDLIHKALDQFCRACPGALPDDAADRLIAIGRETFSPLMDDSDVANFWWPRFMRIARWFAAEEQKLRAEVKSVATELSGAVTIDLPGMKFTLTGRADRIDLLKDGRARIVDYKTGSPPSWKQVEKGFNPQLTLEAAILARGGFKSLGQLDTAGLVYIRLSGGEPAGECRPCKQDAMTMANAHYDGLVRLLSRYLDPQQPYIPRYAPKSEDDVLDYDHLSRFKEWSLAGVRG